MLRISIFYSILIFSFVVSANVADPEIMYMQYNGGISDLPESLAESNSIYRNARFDKDFGIDFETTIYRITLDDDEITDIVKYELIEENLSYFYDMQFFVFSDHCVKLGKYLYISDLDCDQYQDDFRSLGCLNYVTVIIDEAIDSALCDPEIYEEVQLDEQEIDELKSETQRAEAFFVFEKEEIDFGKVCVGQYKDKKVVVKNATLFKNKSYFRDQIISEGFEIIKTDAEDDCCNIEVFEPQQQCYLKIRFSPENNIPYSELIHADNDELNLKGEGTYDSCGCSVTVL